MGLIRGSLLVIASVLFFISLLTFNSLWVLSDSLKYENVQEEIVPVITEIIGEQINLSEEIKEKVPVIENYCENSSEFVFSEGGYTIDIPCTIVSEGSDAIIEESISDIANQTYHQEYGCDFWDCFKKTSQPFFLISEKAYNYWKSKFYFALLISLALFLALFLLVENKSNAFIIGSSLVILSSLPLIKIESFLSLFMNEFFLNIFKVFFSKSQDIFFTMLVIGIILFVFGIALKFFKIGFKISDFIQGIKSGKKETRNISKKAIGKKK